MYWCSCFLQVLIEGTVVHLRVGGSDDILVVNEPRLDSQVIGDKRRPLAFEETGIATYHILLVHVRVVLLAYN